MTTPGNGVGGIPLIALIEGKALTAKQDAVPQFGPHSSQRDQSRHGFASYSVQTRDCSPARRPLKTLHCTNVNAPRLAEFIA